MLSIAVRVHNTNRGIFRGENAAAWRAADER
jgi:hypothetical protein